MSQALTRYQALFDSIRSRQRRIRSTNALDRLAGTLGLRWRTRRISPTFLRQQAELTDALAAEYRGHSDAALDAAVARSREAFVRARGRLDDESVRRALAVVREVARRTTGQEAFVVQLMGALALHHGRIIEMLTGEGKTLTGSIAAVLIAWQRKRLHIFTVNDYLAKRDAESREPIYSRCLLKVGAIEQALRPDQRADVYARHIVYGTPKQIVADWLRDQIRLGVTPSAWAGRRDASAHTAGTGGPGGEQGGPIVPGIEAALVDEADAVLIDEGVVPLIIARSRRTDEMADAYRMAAGMAAKLDAKAHYTTDQLRRDVELTRAGRDRYAELRRTLVDPMWKARTRAEELLRKALIARHCYINGRHYQIHDGRVVIVDEYTGRFLADRTWEHGLHQAVEAKEGLEVTADRETLARLSFQRYFKMYPFLCGMTGTVAEARSEMERTYQRLVTVIPTNRPCIRAQWPMRIFRSSEARWAAVADSIEKIQREGRAVLVGTRSVEASQRLSDRLATRGLAHKVLNALNDKDEAAIIAGAGRSGSIVIATNMAGRGTDILLDEPTRAAGGLHVILTELHGSRRIDRQFIGRAGRQGDPGSAQIFASLEDEIVRLYARRMGSLLRVASRGGGGDELSGRALDAATAALRIAQRSNQARDRRMRAEVLRQDDWIDKYLPGQ